jgi:hypothetical protein
VISLAARGATADLNAFTGTLMPLASAAAATAGFGAIVRTVAVTLLGRAGAAQ